MSYSFRSHITSTKKVNVLVLQMSLFSQDYCMNPAAGFQVPDFESSLNVPLNVPQADCGVIEECAVSIIKEGFTEFIDDKGTNRLLRFLYSMRS